MLKAITRSLTSAAAFLAVASIYGVGPAVAHTEEYYTSHMCQATDQNGIHTSQVRFEAGLAVNRHNSNTYFLRCPVPYVRKTNNLNVIRVRLRASDRHSQKRVVLRICEVRDNDASVICPNGSRAQSGLAFDGGLVTLSAAFTPVAETRWVFLRIEIPDRDTQTGLSFVVGYRVCRGAC